MSAATLTNHSLTPPVRDGLRPIDLGTDLPALADLMEIGFADALDDGGRAMLREMRMLGRTGWLLNATNRMAAAMGGLQQGYVWMADGKLVGNVSTMPMSVGQSFMPNANSHGTQNGLPNDSPNSRSGHLSTRGAIVANVVVHPDYRRQGIARALLHASLIDLARRQFGYASLQVVADNAGALQLYEQFGFRAIRTFTRWQRPARLRTPLPLASGSALPEVTLRAARDWRAEYNLADRVRPNALGGLGWLRPTTPAAFNPSALERIGGWLVGYARESWVMYASPDSVARNRQIVAAARLMMSFGSPDRIDVLVDPAVQGQAERLLLNAVMQRLGGRIKPVVTEHPTDDSIGSAVLAEYGFEPRRTETIMRLDSLISFSRQTNGMTAGTNLHGDR